MNNNTKITLFVLYLFFNFVHGFGFYPFGNFNNPILPSKNLDILDKSLNENLVVKSNLITDNFKYSITCIEHDFNEVKSSMGKQFVINLSSLLPKVDSIGHDVLQINNRFIVDVLSYENVPDDIKKNIILLSIKLAQYGDDMGSVFLQQYYNLVDTFL